jgi:hypothetical protein
MEERYNNAIRVRELGIKFVDGTDEGITYFLLASYVDGIQDRARSLR